MNVAAWLAKAESFLEEREVPEARASAEFLLGDVLGVGRASAASRGLQDLSEKQGYRFWRHVKERGRRLPIAYILGWQPFLGLRIEVTRDSLIPRPETEELVIECERLIQASQVPAPKIVEIGTGTGCVAIALAQLIPSATVFATDVSDQALALAQKNAIALHSHQRIRFVREDLFSGRPGLRGWADLLVSNPPYIPTADLDDLEPEVLMEPRLALDGGKDGLVAIRAIVAVAPKMLKPGGFLALEIESRQGPAVSQLLHAAGFEGVLIKKDASGRDRIAVARVVENA
ncbi:MAG: peptide chain release factor N(5)-glutamine methyltransferase [Elusimicrobia bacterium]|nr:peptide chain release factor N(5)-glutamine methyltransferase [Elusimicrobiota bacterium]